VGSALAKYDQAKRALAEAKTLADVTAVKGLAAAIEALGRIARDRSIIADANELMTNADRKLGEMLKAAKAAGQIARGRNWKSNSSDSEELERITLDEVGVDHKLSSRAQRIAEITPDAYEQMLATHREAILKGRNVSFDTTVKERDLERQRQQHQHRTYEGGTADHLQQLIDAGKKFGAIYADPAWLFLSRGEHGEGRSASAHYTTTTLDGMKALPIAELAAENCVLFMWMVDWCPQDALDLMRAWGFTHKTTAFTWTKTTENGAEFMGQGYWTRANPEDCWLATRGNPKRLFADVRQLVTAPVMEHSRKPDEIYARIERLVAGPYLELFARRPRDGWVSWGNELPFVMPGETLPYDPETGEILESEAERAVHDAPALPAPESAPAARDSGVSFTVLSEDDGGAAASEAFASPVEPHEVRSGGEAQDTDDGLDIPAFLRRRA
jgi:N6-adenosine-specific RNA methylase IME4